MAESVAKAGGTGDVDAKSESSLEVMPAFEETAAKPGPGALPAGKYDPLRFEHIDGFWGDIEKSFNPITTADVSYLKHYAVNPYGGTYDEALRLHPNASSDAQSASARGAARPPPSHAAPIDLTSLPNDRAVLNSYPLTQRLVAALVDEGGGAQFNMGAPRPPRAGTGDADTFWTGLGTDTELRTYQRAMETRVAHELKEVGLLPDNAAGDELTNAIRHDQWKLRDVKTGNRARKIHLYSLIAGGELRAQAQKREKKERMNDIEIAYLERMNKKLKKNKKARNKYQKLLQRMFKNYKSNKPPASSPTASVGPGASTTLGATSKESTPGLSPRASSSALALTANAGSSGNGVTSGGRASSAASLGLDDRPNSRNKSVKKKKKKSEGSSTRPPPASKSAASKGKVQRLEDIDI